MKFNMTMCNLGDCVHQRYVKGYKIGRDDGYPCSAWGHYLPGDEPHYECNLSGEECIEDEDGYIAISEITECGRFERTDQICEDCSDENEDEPTYLYKDTITERIFCPECCKEF